MAVGVRVWSLAPISSGLAEQNGRATSKNQSRHKDGGQARAKTYSRRKLTLGLLNTALFFAFALVVVVTGFSRSVSSFASSLTSNDYAVFLVFAATLGVLEILISFPLKFYSSFYLEHRYGLSNQTLLRWLGEQAKAVLVGIPLILPVLLFFYYCLRTYGSAWWLPVGIMLFLATTVLARIAPKIIFPLFYKFKPLDKAELKERVARMCNEAGFRIEGVFSFNMSKNTKKANAGLTGIGKSKRVILGDTLLEKFTDEEIEAVLAHELGHYRGGHIWKGILLGTVSTFLGLFITSRLYAASASLFGFQRLDDPAALPLLGLWLGIFGLVFSPVNNGVSRRYEFEADRYAVEQSTNPRAFIDALKKLAEMNLADTAPNPVVEFLFYSHPSIEKRIQSAERNLVKDGSVAH